MVQSALTSGTREFVILVAGAVTHAELIMLQTKWSYEWGLA